MILPPHAGAENPGVPLDLQAPILLKVLSFDKSLPDRAPQHILLGVVAARQPDLDASHQAFAAYKGKTLQSLPIDTKKMLFSSGEKLEKEMQDTGAFAALYLAEGLNAKQVAAIAELGRKYKVPLLSGNIHYPHWGAAVGLKTEQKKPKIIINITAAQNYGMQLPPEVLALAEIIENGK